ncbi:MAG TPA: hypothetical protein VEQ85_10340, partial [Lacipirellulaceae bacterium]|nr:hypothetical protein [Lacipirellulaceae bacterium]
MGIAAVQGWRSGLGACRAEPLPSGKEAYYAISAVEPVGGFLRMIADDPARFHVVLYTPEIPYNT